MSGFCRQAAAKMSTTSSEATARETICRQVQVFVRLHLALRPLQEPAAHRLHEGDLVVWDGEHKRLHERPHRVQEAVLAVLLGEDMLLRLWQQRQALGRGTGNPARSVEAVEEPAADLVLLQHHGDRLFLIERRVPRAAALGVSGERLLELMRQPSVVHHQPTRFVAEDLIHPGNRLH